MTSSNGLRKFRLFTQVADGTAPPTCAATSESGFGIRVIHTGGSVQARIFTVLAVLVPVGARPALPSVHAAADEIRHHVDASAIIAAGIPGAIVDIYTHNLTI